jgi:hypothetical protein
MKRRGHVFVTTSVSVTGERRPIHDSEQNKPSRRRHLRVASHRKHSSSHHSTSRGDKRTQNTTRTRGPITRRRGYARHSLLVHSLIGRPYIPSARRVFADLALAGGGHNPQLCGERP